MQKAHSLTHTIARRYTVALFSRVLFEGWAHLDVVQKRALGLNVARAYIGWVRHIILTDGQSDFVEAISVFSTRTLKGRGARFRHLGAMPLGKWLFYRTPFLPVYRRIDGRTRVSVFDYHGTKVLLTETLLGNLPMDLFN